VQKVAKAVMRSPLLIGSKNSQTQATSHHSVDNNKFKTVLERQEYILTQELAQFEAVNNGYIQHGYLEIETINRFNLLFSYIKKSLLNKTVIFVQTPDEVKHITALLRVFEIATFSLHEKLSDVEKVKVFSQFEKGNAGVIFVTQYGLRGLKFKSAINTIIHYDNPITSLRYLDRLTHFPPVPGAPGQREPTLNSILIILTENELPNLEKMLTQIKIDKFQLPNKIINIYKETLHLTDTNFFLNTSALKAYFAYMRCYIQFSKDGTYDYKGIDNVSLARSFGLEFPPAIKE
jgi:superfamily II DNA/RNA helicase